MTVETITVPMTVSRLVKILQFPAQSPLVKLPKVPGSVVLVPLSTGLRHLLTETASSSGKIASESY